MGTLSTVTGINGLFHFLTSDVVKNSIRLPYIFIDLFKFKLNKLSNV